MAAGRAPVSANLSGQNNPNKKQPLEIALEREGDQLYRRNAGQVGIAPANVEIGGAALLALSR